jgi:drug/metabolite transporter (DMT)-like permease
MGIFGVYYSLQYLSLSDSIVLTFLSPLSTAIAGALVLNEKFKKGESLAGS